MALFRKPEDKQQADEIELLRQEIIKAQMPSSVEVHTLKELDKL